jgi:hypothetical protein
MLVPFKFMTLKIELFFEPLPRDDKNYKANVDIGKENISLKPISGL